MESLNKGKPVKVKLVIFHHGLPNKKFKFALNFALNFINFTLLFIAALYVFLLTKYEEPGLLSFEPDRKTMKYIKGKYLNNKPITNDFINIGTCPYIRIKNSQGIEVYDGEFNIIPNLRILFKNKDEESVFLLRYFDKPFNENDDMIEDIFNEYYDNCEEKKKLLFLIKRISNRIKGFLLAD